jgi:hypothetical protein
VPRNNERKETNDRGTILDGLDRAVWSAIRYLDPEADPKESNIAAPIAVFAVVCIVSLVWVLLHLRDL